VQASTLLRTHKRFRPADEDHVGQTH
jgi:hypothetical protein